MRRAAEQGAAPDRSQCAFHQLCAARRRLVAVVGRQVSFSVTYLNFQRIELSLIENSNRFRLGSLGFFFFNRKRDDVWLCRRRVFIDRVSPCTVSRTRFALLALRRLIVITVFSDNLAVIRAKVLVRVGRFAVIALGRGFFAAVCSSQDRASSCCTARPHEIRPAPAALGDAAESAVVISTTKTLKSLSLLRREL
jgi:hypothetical protein